MDLSQLNPQQREAVEHTDGPMLVLAGAGTGKTMVITWRVAAMLARGVAPENILAVTFTNKAAREMKERIAKLVAAAAAENLTVSTFHAFGCGVLRRHIRKLGYGQRFGIADQGDQLGLVRQAMGELGLGGEGGMRPPAYREGISKFKNDLMSPDQVRSAGRASWFKDLANVYERYQELLQSMNLLDFDDLLLLVLRLWGEKPDVLAAYRDRFHYLLVDEFQDTNPAQAELIRRLAGKRCNVCVVGDDDQSIYGWRGAAVENILEFPESYPGTRLVKLEQNYRSTNTILGAANSLIGHNRVRHGKSLWSGKPEGEQIRVITARDDGSEARLVGRWLQQARQGRAVEYNEMAVLFRSNHQSRAYEEVLRESRIPYRMVGAKSFYERREIRDAVAYLCLLHNPRDDLSLMRVLNVPPRGIGKQTIDRLKEARGQGTKSMVEILAQPSFLAGLGKAAATSCRHFAQTRDRFAQEFAGGGKLAERIDGYLEQMGYLSGLKRIYHDHEESLQRRENVRELIHAAAQFEAHHGPLANLQDFLEICTLEDDSDRLNDQTEDGSGVTLMTIHAAKGLEFDLVLIVGMEQGLFPHARALEDRDLDEERRLFYVAVTRARNSLVMTRALRRVRYGGRETPRPSQFIGELPADLLELTDENKALRLPTQDETGDFIAEMRARLEAEE